MQRVSTPEADQLADAAREWLTLFLGMYQDQDWAGSDPTRSAVSHARWSLNVGPSPADPFTICGLMIGALPDDQRTHRLTSFWCDMFLQALELADAATGHGTRPPERAEA
jgi:hypothetical protein